MARFLLFVIFVGAPAMAQKCIPFEQASEHIGKTTCVSGRVLKVHQTQAGTSFLDFCEDYKTCPFTVIVMRDDLKNIGDVRLLEGKTSRSAARSRSTAGGRRSCWNDRDSYSVMPPNFHQC